MTTFERRVVSVLFVGFYLLILSPLIFYSTFNQPFLFLKNIFLLVTVELLAALYIPLAIFYPRWRVRRTPVNIFFALLVFILLLTSTIGANWQQSLWSTPERLLGLLTVVHFWVLFVILAGLRRVIHWQNLLCTSLFVSLITALVAIIQSFSMPRPGSLFGNPAFLASYLMFHCFIGGWLSYFYYIEKKKWLAWLGGVIVVVDAVAIMLTETRAVILAVGVGAVILLITLGIHFRRRAPFVIASVLTVAALSFFLTRNASIWQSLPGLNRFAGQTSAELGFSGRLVAWEIAGQGIKERPLLGWGWENFSYVYDKYYQPTMLRNQGSTTSFDRPHNVFLDYATGAGAIGLLGFIAFIAAIFYELKKIRGDTILFAALVGAFTAYIVQSFFLFDTYGSYLMLVMTLGLIEGQYRKELPDSLPTPSRPHSGPAVVATALIVVVFSAFYFLHSRVLAGNHYQYWGANYLSNGLVQESLASWDRAVALQYPYHDFAVKEYLAGLEQLSVSGLSESEINERSRIALESMEQAIARKPLNYEFRTAISDAYIIFLPFNPTYAAKAEEHIAKSLEISPRRQHSYYLLAKLAIATDRFDDAKKFADQAIALDPLAGDAHFFKALIDFNIDAMNNGIAEIEQAKALGRIPNNNREAKTIGGYYADAKEYKEAIDYFNLAITYDHNDVEALLKKGWVLYMAGDREQARIVLQEFLTRFPNFKQTSAYTALAHIFSDLGL